MEKKHKLATSKLLTFSLVPNLGKCTVMSFHFCIQYFHIADSIGEKID